MDQSLKNKDTLEITYKEYFKDAYGLWVGKFIGGTMGAKYEGFKKELAVDVTDMLPLQLVENDDTDLQLLWLHALQQWGPHLTSQHLLNEWREHVRVPWNEYGVAAANWERGIVPPESGVRDNWYFENGMGCPIRSEIWGIICPGLPKLAARYARQDAELDHGSESIQAEIFLSVVEASVFFEKDLEKLIEIGFAHIDSSSRFAKLVERVVDWCRDDDWRKVRRLILKEFGHPDFTNSLQNMGIIIMSLLLGKGDFLKTMNIAINSGYDTDCTAASAGAILNAIHGSENLPESLRHSEIVSYKISSWMSGFPDSGSLENLTHACCSIGARIAGENGVVVTGVPTILMSKLILSVEPRKIEEIVPSKNPFPSWIIGGPYFRDYEELMPQHPKYPDHGIPLPSAKYMTHMYSDLNCVNVNAKQASLVGVGSTEKEGVIFVKGQDSRLNLDDYFTEGILPASFFLYSEFDSSVSSLNWLLVGSTGPLEFWMNGACLLKSDSYQPLNPTSFDLEVKLREGKNRLFIKLLKTSQKPEICLQFKHHEGEHWHQSFINTRIEWTDFSVSQAI